MRKLAYAFAILAAAASTAAVAKDLKQDKKAAAPTVSAQQMTDSEMDKVTAGITTFLMEVGTPNPRNGQTLTPEGVFSGLLQRISYGVPMSGSSDLSISASHDRTLAQRSHAPQPAAAD